MIASVELQMISKILTSQSDTEIDALCSYDDTYYSVFKPQIKFILDHRIKYDTVPDIFTFRSQFPDIELVSVNEPIEYLIKQIKKNKEHIILLETFNKLKDLGSGDVTEAWQYLANQCERVSQLDDTQPMDIVKDAKKRADQVIEFSKQARIPTGFAEIDKLMYGGLSTVEELLIILARTNTGKSWVCTKMMESAQRNGFPVLYYSPEMQSSYLGTRFDTWRAHFQNSQLHQGKYNDQYIEYIDKLSSESTSAFVLEDKDVSEGCVNTKVLVDLVKKHDIKLLIIDGLSYVSDSNNADKEYTKYKNICNDLFRLSKKYSCAVVIAMQANRDTKDMKDEKGQPFPDLYNAEGSDHPARIATQAFALRQVFDKHVLDIRLEKSRNANNQKPVLSYSWDVNTGNMQFLPQGADGDEISTPMPTVNVPQIVKHKTPDDMIEDELDDDENIEF